MDPIHRELLQQAVDAAKSGETENAIDLIKQVLDEDEENAQAWMLLARLTEDIDEKRVALTNVLALRPGDKRAEAMLKQLEKEAKKRNVVEVLPGISRRLFIMVALSIVAVIVAGLLVITNISNRNAQRQQELQNEQNTQQAQGTQIVLDTTYEAETAVQQQLDLTATELFLNPPTATIEPTSNAPTLPPTQTFTPEPSLTPTPLPPPPGLSGQLLGWSGIGEPDEDLDLVRYSLTGDEPETFLDTNGRLVQQLVDDGQYIYSFYNSTSFSNELRIIDANGVPNERITRRDYGFFFIDEPEMFSLSVDGTAVVMVAENPPGSSARGNTLYLVDLTASGADAVRQLTFDDAEYSYPAISPDGRQVVVVRNVLGSDNLGVDLVLIDLATDVPSSLTTDRNATEETTPAWSPDGALIFYSGLDTTTADATFDLFMITPTNPDSGVVRQDSSGDILFPVVGPTGTYVAYADDRLGNFDVFLLDLNTSQEYKITRGNRDDFPSDWR